MNTIKKFDWFQKFFFTLVLFLLTDGAGFIRFINYLSVQSFIRHAVNSLTAIPLNDSSKVFRSWCKGISSLTLDVAFWFIIIMLILYPGIFARMRKMIWNNRAIVLLLMLISASWLWSIAPVATLKGVLLVLKITVIGLYISQAYSAEEILDILVWIIAIGSVLSILVIWRIPEQGTVPTTGGGALWQGVYSFKNFLGRLMGFGNAMLVIYWLKSAGNIVKRILALVLFILTGVLLFFSDSATGLAILAVMYGALILYWMWDRWMMQLSARVRWSFAALGAASLILGLWNYEFILVLLGRSPTLSYRTLLWGTLWPLFQERPLFGFGYEAFWQQFPDGIAVNGYAGAPILHAHNGYLEIAMGLGLSGLIIFAVFLVTLWKRSLSFIGQNRQIIFFWPVLALIYLTLANITYSVALEDVGFHWALFIIVAGIVSPSQSTTQEQLKDILPSGESLQTRVKKLFTL